MGPSSAQHKWGALKTERKTHKKQMAVKLALSRAQNRQETRKHRMLKTSKFFPLFA
jgi:hypothetical protein